MKVRFFDDDENIANEIVSLIAEKKLIPVIGSGFSRGCQARSGSVPSGRDLVEHMKSKIKDITDEPDAILSKYTFQQLCKIYAHKVDVSSQLQYLTSNFTNVSFPQTRRDFVNIDWGCIYTLNIDDGIERCSERHVILPRAEFIDEYINSFKTVFKIHGDVHDYLKYADKDSRGIIFDRSQYINSLRNNKFMLSRFSSDFVDGNIAYIGCSLDDEPDLLSAIQDALSKGFSAHSTYYISILSPDDNMIILLEDYGITDYVVIRDIDLFCKKIVDSLAKFSEKPKATIDYYKEKDIVCLDRFQSNIKFLLKSNNLIKIPFTAFFKPHFFIVREVVPGIIRSLKIESPVHIVHGHRVSGKTYCLFGIYEQIKNKTRYFFPSGMVVTKDFIDFVLSAKNCSFIFDTSTLDVRQIIMLTEQVKRVKRNESYIIIAVNSSDRTGIDLSPYHSNNYSITEIKNVFSKTEECCLNLIFQNSNIPTFSFRNRIQRRGTASFYERPKTLLDNLYTTAIKFNNNQLDYKFPDLSRINSPIEFALIILFATLQNLDLTYIHYYSLERECKDFLANNPILADIAEWGKERSSGNSQKTIIINARYFLLKTLGDYALDHTKRNLIVNSYRYIYRKIDESEFELFDKSKRMLDFIKYDVINDIFMEKNDNVTVLIKHIYKELEPELNTSPQFKHQRAKSILWLCNDNIDDIINAAKYIDLAEHDMLNLLKKKPYNTRLQYAYEHILYTQAIIYGRLCGLENYSNIESMKKAISCYGISLLNPRNKQDLVYLKSQKLDHRVASDLKNLLTYLLNTATNVPAELKSEASYLSSEIGDIC